MLSAAVNFNYSWKISEAKRLRETHDLGEDARSALGRLVETRELFGPARQHFKTLYFQWELIDLSRGVLATAIPALLVAVCMMAFFDPARYAGGPLDPGSIVGVVALTATVSTLPFLVLLAYVPRIATVTKHTLSMGPFLLRETGGVETVEWGEESR